jgi:hypothetical protein
MKKNGAILLASIAMVGCGGTEDDRAPVDPDGFPPVAAGYTRFVAPVVEDIEPGVDATYCQYITEPFQEDTDIVDFTGWQSVGGHHLVLYATSTHAPVGTSRECNDSDMVSVHFLGGVGGEGVARLGALLPEGATFRIPKGYALMANVHYLNASSTPIDGKGFIDMKLASADPMAKVATLFVNVDQNISVPPHQSGSLDAKCVVQEEMELYMLGNHLHEHGKSIFSEVIRTDGTTELLKQDDVWTKEMTFNPPIALWDADKPLKFNVGDTVHTHCEWNNPTSDELTFPTEMCVTFGLFIGGAQLNCVDGVWDAH